MGLGIDEYWIIKWKTKTGPSEAFLNWREESTEIQPHYYSVVCSDENQVKLFTNMLKRNLDVTEVKIEKKR
jgi:hypothetical protein